MTPLDYKLRESTRELLALRQPAALRRSRAGATERGLVLAVLRGALLDLLATGDEERTAATVETYLARLPDR